MFESQRNTAPDQAGMPHSDASPPPPPHDPPQERSDVFFVGSGDCAALVDHIELLQTEPEPARAAKDAAAAQQAPDVARQFRDRVAHQQTGRPLAVSLDRRLFLAASAQRRKQVEDRIRALHGTRLHDGRTLYVDEILGRYGRLLGGLDQQLLEVRARLKEGQYVRLAVRSKILSDQLYRRLGILSDRFGGQLNLSVDHERIDSNAFHDRLAWEAFLAQVAAVRARLQRGQRVVLRVESAELNSRLRREIEQLQRQFGDRLRVQIRSHPGQPQSANADVWRATVSAVRSKDRRPKPADMPADGSLPAVAPDDGDRSVWAREVAARVRKPWWRRVRLPWPRKSRR